MLQKLAAHPQRSVQRNWAEHMLIIFAFTCVTSSDHTATRRDVIGCNKKYYANDTASCSLNQFLQIFADNIASFLRRFYFLSLKHLIYFILHVRTALDYTSQLPYVRI